MLRVIIAIRWRNLHAETEALQIVSLRAQVKIDHMHLLSTPPSEMYLAREDTNKVAYWLYEKYILYTV